MKVAKVLLLLGAGLLVLIVLAVVVAFISIDRIAKTGIVKGTNYALAVPTSLDSADVGIMSGTFEMSGLQVDNPEGFKSPFFFRMGDAGVAVSLASLRSDVITLPRLALSDIDVHLDRADGRSNVKQILDNLKRFESTDPDEPTPEQAPGKQFIVNEIEIRNVTTHVHLLPLGGQLSTTKLIIPEILLKDVGSAGNPVTLAELTNIITQAILASAAEIGGGVIPDEILGDLKTNLEGLNALAENGVEMLTTGANEALEEARDKLEETTEDLEGKAKDAINEGLDSILRGRERKSGGD